MLTAVVQPSQYCSDLCVIRSKTCAPLTGGSCRRSPTKSMLVARNHVFKGLVVFEPTTPIVGHGDVHPLYGGRLLGEVVAEQEVAGLIQSALAGA